MRTISHSTRFRQMNQEVYNKLTNAFQNTCRIAGLFAVFHHNTFTLLFVCSQYTYGYVCVCTVPIRRISDLWADTLYESEIICKHDIHTHWATYTTYGMCVCMCVYETNAHSRTYMRTMNGNTISTTFYFIILYSSVGLH